MCEIVYFYFLKAVLLSLKAKLRESIRGKTEEDRKLYNKENTKHIISILLVKLSNRVDLEE